MRILHVVTLVDDEAGSGGPLAVALSQCTELRRRGHDARILAGWRGSGRPPAQLEGVPVHLFPVRALAPGVRHWALASPAMASWLRRQARSFDVAHLHFARDLVPITAARLLDRAQVPYLAQTHGMVHRAWQRPTRLADRLLAVPALRAATRRLAADPAERRLLGELTGSAAGITLLSNGVAAGATELEGLYTAATSDAQTLLWVTSEVTPYRRALWREIGRVSELTVALLAETRANWRLQLESSREPFTVVQMHARAAREVHGVTLYAPPAALRLQIQRRPDAVVLDGWESPALHRAARWARRYGVAVVASYRGTRTTLPAPTPASMPEPRVPQARPGHRYLYVGRLVTRRNVEGLVRAFALARQAGDVLTIVGTGPMQSRLVALAERLGVDDAVVFRGQLDDADAAAELRAAQTLVLPSTDELWGSEVDAALDAGLNAVVSTACGVAESVAAMPTVFVAEPTPPELARAMRLSQLTLRV